jgi:predicted dehydrogenase
MGKAHAVAMSAVGAVFNTNLRPRLKMVCGASPVTSKKYCMAYGFKRAADNWEQLVTDKTLKP